MCVCVRVSVSMCVHRCACRTPGSAFLMEPTVLTLQATKENGRLHVWAAVREGFLGEVHGCDVRSILREGGGGGGVTVGRSPCCWEPLS